MKNKILELIKDKPKHYSILIKKDEAMHDWVKNNTKVDDTHSFVEKIFSAIHDTNLICPNGNKKKVRRWNDGALFCGHQSICKCSKDSTSCGVSSTKSKITKVEVEISNRKRCETLKAKTGYEYNSQRPDIKEKLKESKLPHSISEKLINKQWLEDQYIKQNKSGLQIANELGCYYGTVLDYCRKHGFEIQKTYNRSLVEIEIQEFIESLGFQVDINRQDLLNGRNEIDIYVPSKCIGIEVNGLYYHSQAAKSGYEHLRTKHLSKTISAEQNGITLIHITDWEWTNKRNIIKSQIKNKLGVSNRVYARNCILGKPTHKEQMDFFSDNHLMGGCSAKVTYGLKYNNEWVMMMSLKKPRYRKGSDYEIIRLSSSLNTTVVGGFSKILKDIKRDYGSVVIESYCDRSKSSGNGYRAVGFKDIGYTDVGFFWTDTKDILSRYMVTKNTLNKWCKHVDYSKSQADNMFANGYKRYWDCGNIIMHISL